MDTEPDGRTLDKQPRVYPYFDLSVAATLARAVYKEGGGSADKRQLAEALGVGLGSSVEMRIISAAMFGLVVRRDQRIEVTEIGRRVASPVDDAERLRALSEAFDAVALFAAVRRHFAGQTLPSESGVKALLVRDFGIPDKKKNETFNLMMKSAKEAGIVRTRDNGTYLSSLTGRGAATRNGEGQGAGVVERQGEPDRTDTSTVRKKLPPPIEALVDELAKDAPEWDADARGVWQAAFNAVLDYVYPKSRQRREVVATADVAPDDLPFE